MTLATVLRLVTVRPPVRQSTDDLLLALLALVRQARCSLHGHDDIVRFGRTRLHLECLSCGRQTPGWEVTCRDRQRET